MNPRVSICLALYRRLASAYPHEFRMLYGGDLDRLGEDAIPEVSRRYGLLGLLRLLADISIRLPATYFTEIRQDTVYALRKLAQSPGFTAVAVLSLAIGIGMCCVALSESQSIAGPPPGVRDPAALVTIRGQVSYPYFERYRDQHQAVANATAFLGLVPFAVAFTGDKHTRAERIYGHLVSPEYFTTLGVTPAAGRFFAPETEKPGMPPVVVISDRFWRKHLGADPLAVGRTLRLNGSMATIVGIGPKDFLGIWPANPADLFVPLTCAGSLAPELGGDPLHAQDREIFRVVFRLPQGVPIPAAEAALDAATRSLDRENGIQNDRDRKGRVVRLIPAGTVMYMTPDLTAYIRTFNIVLWTLVLSLLCANLASLLLARGSQRRREIAVRLSVGASRPRLVRQFLTESVLLSFSGGVAGIALAYGLARAINSMPVPSATPFEFNCQPDFHVLAITLAVALAAGIGFGLAPALSSVRADIGLTLKQGAQAPLVGYRRFGLRNLFVVGQMTASLMLLLLTWYMVTGFLNSAHLDPGFETANLNLISLDPVRDGYSAEATAALLSGLPEELSRVTGVRGVTLTDSVPFAGLAAEQANTRVSASAGAGKTGQVLHAVFRERIGAGYFVTLGVPLLGGREFDRRDQQLDDSSETKGAPAIPAILNQTAAHELFGAEEPIGRRVREGEMNYTVVGLTHDVQSGLLMTKTVATVFLPLTASAFRSNPAQRATILVRGSAGRDTLTAVRRQLASLHPDLTIFNVHTMQEDLDRMNSFVKWDSAIYVILGLFALLLASIGLGGVTAYAVVRRRKEIGIRMALGAGSRQVQGLVMREGTVLVVVGSVLGLGGGLTLWRVLSSASDVLARTFSKRADDPLLFYGAPLLLAGLAMLACYLPARRATDIDPVSALREE
ncbi:MAG: ADOP family duplicated permease [Bryobacteraceae bacterium]|jgi:predicted permease